MIRRDLTPVEREMALKAIGEGLHDLMQAKMDAYHKKQLQRSQDSVISLVDPASLKQANDNALEIDKIPGYHLTHRQDPGFLPDLLNIQDAFQQRLGVHEQRRRAELEKEIAAEEQAYLASLATARQKTASVYTPTHLLDGICEFLAGVVEKKAAYLPSDGAISEMLMGDPYSTSPGALERLHRTMRQALAISFLQGTAAGYETRKPPADAPTAAPAPRVEIA